MEDKRFNRGVTWTDVTVRTRPLFHENVSSDATSRHVMPRRVTSRSVTSGSVTSRRVTWPTDSVPNSQHRPELQDWVTHGPSCVCHRIFSSWAFNAQHGPDPGLPTTAPGVVWKISHLPTCAIQLSVEYPVELLQMSNESPKLLSRNGTHG